MRLKDWRWNREGHRWELAETGEEFTAADAVIHGPTPAVVAVVTAVAVAVARIIPRRLQRRRAASTRNESS